MTAPAHPVSLTIRDLTVAYPDSAPIVAGWHAALAPGVTLVEGDTGSGKSTLVRVLAGEQRAQGGALALGGLALDRNESAYCAQVWCFDPATDAHDHALTETLPGALAIDAAAWHAHARAFGLEPHFGKAMYMLSTGSRRKAWLAAAMACARPLVLLDEPTAALDAPSIAHLMRALGELARRRERIVVVASSQALPESIALEARYALPLAPPQGA